MVAAFGTGPRSKRQGTPLVDIWTLWRAGLLDPCANHLSILLNGERREIALSSWVPRPDWRPGSALPAFVCPACGRRCWRLWTSNTRKLGCRACAGTPRNWRIADGWGDWGNPVKMHVRASLALGRRLRRARLLVRAARRRKDISDAGN